MRRGSDLQRRGGLLNERAAAHMAANQPFGFELSVSVRDSRAVNAKLHGEFAAGGDAVPGAEIPGVDERAKLVAQLDIERNVTFGL